ncbi:hypothetical protein L6164_001305 [Bauhinia variegata]|uniref:Uncharacterized protein n=1 Tax=Bauhinia variegata TaxID=167791 RepID=A0ACB9Q993_BAUVA|nr:hypothetical protein L6164_001305 [Bauhinia variegata]
MPNDWFKMDHDDCISLIRNPPKISKEDMLASIDPVKKLSMPKPKRILAELSLDTELSSESYGKGIIRCKFQDISYSNCKNLLAYASNYDKLWFTPSWVEIVVKELQSILKEYESKPGITDARLPLSISSAEQITNSSCCNSGEQYLRGLVNNQTGYVLGNGNGSYIVMTDCKISVYNRN